MDASYTPWSPLTSHGSPHDCSSSPFMIFTHALPSHAAAGAAGVHRPALAAPSLSLSAHSNWLWVPLLEQGQEARPSDLQSSLPTSAVPALHLRCSLHLLAFAERSSFAPQAHGGPASPLFTHSDTGQAVVALQLLPSSTHVLQLLPPLEAAQC